MCWGCIHSSVGKVLTHHEYSSGSEPHKHVKVSNVAQAYDPSTQELETEGTEV